MRRMRVGILRRPRSAPELLCVGYAWTGANGWRATLARLDLLGEGGSLDYGASEIWAVGIGTALSLLLFAILLVLVLKVAPRNGRSIGTG
jgi:hypothetical protein